MAITSLRNRTTIDNAHGAAPAAGVRPTPIRKRNHAWITLGVLLVFGAGLAVALWSSAQADRTIVLVTAKPVEAGQVIEADDLREASINTDTNIGAVPTAAMVQLVGKVARGPIPANTPLQFDMVADASVVPNGHVVVGLSLVAGEYATSRLRAGDAVIVLETTSGATATAAPRELARGRVWSVETLDRSTDGRLFVSITVPEPAAASVGNAAATNRVRLLLHGSST